MSELPTPENQPPSLPPGDLQLPRMEHDVRQLTNLVRVGGHANFVVPRICRD
jgi:hypothetical protein